MSQKSFDDIENRIREAAANSEPAFDEQAWLKMEVLLNKEDRKKRRFFIWWRYGLPLLLIAVGVAGYWYFNKQPVEKTTAEIATVNTASTTINEPNLTNSNKIKLDVEQKNKTIKLTEKIISGKAGIQSKDAGTLNKETFNQQEKSVSRQKDVKDSHLTFASTSMVKKVKLQKKGSTAIKIGDSEASTENNATMGDNEIVRDSTTEENEPISTAEKENTDLIAKNIATDSISNAAAVKETKPTTAEKKFIASTNKANRKPSSAKGLSKWYLLAALGTEVSGVKFLSFLNSTVTPRYGAGIGFQINKKISVQTGFYAGRKKYIGGSEDYHAKAGSYWSTVDIKKVDASCLIYDIPVTVRYNFVQKNTLIFYGTTGISSFIMKKEDYNYYYTYNNNYYEKARSYTGNKNLFSVLSISAGIEKKLGPRFSFLAEPYLSFPLAGVGEGSVKLYSAGLQIGLKYSPFFK